MTDLRPAAQAVLDALSMEELNGPQQTMAFAHAAAALRAVVDQVSPKEWSTIEAYNQYDQGVAAAHVKHRKQILAIADELEAQ